MAEKRPEKEEARIHAILQAINSGLDVNKALTNLQQEEVNQFGQHKEERVARILMQLNYIDALSLTGKWSKDDHQGRDIALRMTNPYSGLEQVVYIQVKSSPERIAEFKHVVKTKFALQDHEVDDFLMKEKLIVIHGRESEQVIIESFEEQLHKVLQHQASLENARRSQIS